MNNGKFYCGTSGLLIPIPKRNFPPEFENSSRLTFYSSLNNSIEINSSFYRIPQAKTINRWAGEVPASFRFTFKLWKGITHTKNLQFNDSDVKLFMSVVDVSTNKKGCILIQFPPSLKIDALAQLETLLEVLQMTDLHDAWKFVVEFRHSSWYQESTYSLLSQFNTGLVIQDMPASATPFDQHTNNLVYLRFHGPNGSYKGGYTDDFLTEYAEYIRGWLDEGKDVYCYFNNTAGEALKNLRTIRSEVDPDGARLRVHT